MQYWLSSFQGRDTKLDRFFEQTSTNLLKGNYRIFSFSTIVLVEHFLLFTFFDNFNLETFYFLKWFPIFYCSDLFVNLHSTIFSFKYDDFRTKLLLILSFECEKKCFILFLKLQLNKSRTIIDLGSNSGY